MLTPYNQINWAFSPKTLLLGFILCLGFGAANVAANTLDDMRFSALPGDRFEVRMQFSEAPPNPEGYTIEQPARIVLDFPGVNSGLAENRFPLSMVNAKSAMILEGDGRTRLILNLAEIAPYNARTEADNTYIIEVGGQQLAARATAESTIDPPVSSAVVADADPSPGTRSRQGGSQGQTQITGIDFRRGDAGEGRVIIGLSDSRVSIDMQESGGAIELNFQGARIPSDLANRYDVVDFATPVRFVDADNQASGAQIRVEASGEYDYLAYQTDKEYIISVKPLSPREIERREDRFDYSGERISLNFQDIEVRAVLQMIAEFTDLNLVTSDSVSGNVALRLDNVPWDQALDLVLRTKGLDKRQVGNVLMVAPAAEIAERERQELETEKQLQELAPLRTEYIRVRYANARALFDLFGSRQGGGGGQGGGGDGSSTGSILSERGQAIVDERTNSIILTDTEDKIAQFRQLVDQIDIPIRQVMIEARIVIANTDFRKDMGVRWGGIGARVHNGNIIEAGGSTESLDSDPGSPSDFFFGSGSTDLEEGMIVDLGVSNPAGSIAFDIISDNIMLDLELSALQDSGQAEIVSQPKVITGDKQRATIESGSEIPYQEASASGATATDFKEAVLKLDVTPQITPDNNIIMDLIINQDSIGELDVGSGIPTIDVTQIQTQVLVADGETVVLGGIYQTEQQTGVTKVPFFGDIPYLGRLFKQTVDRQNKRELLIFITPRIMADTLVK